MLNIDYVKYRLSQILIKSNIDYVKYRLCQI